MDIQYQCGGDESRFLFQNLMIHFFLSRHHWHAKVCNRFSTGWNQSINRSINRSIDMSVGRNQSRMCQSQGNESLEARFRKKIGTRRIATPCHHDTTSASISQLSKHAASLGVRSGFWSTFGIPRGLWIQCWSDPLHQNC